MIDVKIHKESLEEDKRRYAYEKAIEAYWKHVDRYHTWMNYYAIFNGALFVGFCTLLTATTRIIAKIGNDQDNYDSLFVDATFLEFKNSYSFILIILCIVGCFSGISWLLSLRGHITWMNNWMNIIHKYEDTSNRVYKIIIASTQDIIKTSEEKSPYSSSVKLYKAYSTSKITECFIFSIILGWIVLMIQVIYWELSKDVGVFLYVILFLSIIVMVSLMIILKRKNAYTFLYSDTSDKVIYEYEKTKTIIYK